MFITKKYSPVVLSKATMFALYLAEQSMKYVLQNQMVRMLHATLDDTKWTDERDYCKTEISASIICRDGRVIQAEAEIKLWKGRNNDWMVNTGGLDYLLRFPNCKETTVYFSFDHDTQEIQKFYLGHSYSDALMGTSPDDERLEGVRKKLFT